VAGRCDKSPTPSAPAEGRKSVEPMAAVTAPARVSVQHQKLLHFVGEGKWSDERLLAKVREL
jgi:SRSO17 transposase